MRTDHNSLVWLLNFKQIEGQLARWIEELAQYTMLIQHRPGKKHVNADALSRIPDNLSSCDEYQDGVPLSDLPCGGCRFCKRAQQQWSSFKDDVDYVVPLTIRNLNVEDEGLVHPNWCGAYTQEELRQKQRDDPDIQQIIDWLVCNHSPSMQELQMTSLAVRHWWHVKSQLRLKNGILFYYWEDPTNPRLLFMVPKSMQEDVLYLCHDVRSTGHFGQTKTLEQLKKSVIWYGMSTACKLYVQACSICNRNKKASVKAKSELGQFHAGTPLERVHIDILGPLTPTTRGNKYILMLVDQFTKWTECYPLPNQSAELVAKTMVDGFFSRFGCPFDLHSDQGKNLDGNLMRALCDLLQITKTRTTPYRPCSNGQVERNNRTLLQAIKCFLKGKQQNWDCHLQQLAGAIRATVNRQTGFTPNLMMLGREVNQPIDILLGTITEQGKREIPDYVKSLAESLQEVHRIARDNLRMAQRRQKRDYDLRTFQRTYSVGDIVLKLDSATKVGQCPKLKPPWKGPYIVNKVLSPVLYVIKDRKRECYTS